jgi:small subunit ribosomal protein S5
MGSANPYNMISATMDGLKQEASPRQVAQRRGKKVADILKKPETTEAPADAAEA